MGKNSPSLGALEAKFMALMQISGKKVIPLGELQRFINISAPSEHELLKRLARKGYIIRLQRGIFLIPEKLPAAGRWRPNEYSLIAEYMNYIGAKYYIGGMIAFHHHGLIQQIPNEFTVYNDKLSGTKMIANLRIKFIKISRDRIDGIEKINLPDGKTLAFISNLARTIVDAIYDWKRYGTMPEVYGWITENSFDDNFISNLVGQAVKNSNKTTIRRIGYCLEQNNIESKYVKKLLATLKPIKNWVSLDPTKLISGHKDYKWGIIDNATID